MHREDRTFKDAEDIERHIIKQMGGLAKTFGLGELVGLIAGTLMLHKDEPVSLDQLVRVTQYSKSTISVTMRNFLQWGLFETIKLEGDRRKYYILRGSFSKILLRTINSIVEYEAKPMIKMIDNYLPLLADMSKEARTKKDEKKANDLIVKLKAIKSEYQEMIDFIDFLNKCAKRFFSEKSK